MAANTIINILTLTVLMSTEGLILRCPMPADLVGKNLLESGIRENTGCKKSSPCSAKAGCRSIPSPRKPSASTTNW